MIEQPFNVSARDDEKQILQRQERLRVQNIGKFKSDVDRRKANTMLNERDHLIDQLKAQRDQKISTAVDEQIRQKVKQRAFMIWLSSNKKGWMKGFNTIHVFAIA